MAERIQKRHERREEAPAEEINIQKVGDVAAQGADIKVGLDDLIDEIDEVLEQNAEEFVKSYIQKGGQ